jgi:hypothetical protein
MAENKKKMYEYPIHFASILCANTAAMYFSVEPLCVPTHGPSWKTAHLGGRAEEVLGQFA